MSGGSWDNVWFKIEDAADWLKQHKNPLRRAFGEYVAKVAEALKDVEWCDSGDSGPECEIESIRACLGENAKALELEQVLIEARKIKAELERLGA